MENEKNGNGNEFDSLKEFFVPEGDDDKNDDNVEEIKKDDGEKSAPEEKLPGEENAREAGQPEAVGNDFEEGETFEVPDGGNSDSGESIENPDGDSDEVLDDPFDSDASDNDEITGFDEKLDEAASSLAGESESHPVDVKTSDAQIDIGSSGEGEGDAGENENNGVEPFTPDEKQDYSKVAGKPPVLNKGFISKALVGTIVVLVLFIFVMPMVTSAVKRDRAAKAKKQRMTATASVARDYRDMVQRDEKGNPLPSVTVVDKDGNVVPIEDEPKKEEEEKKEAEPKPKQSQVKNNYSGKTQGSGWTPPDTRNDALQAKTITGIKGLTSTRSNYATDYGMTMEKNAADAAATSSTTDSFSSMTDALLQSKNDTMSRLLDAQQGMASAYKQQNDQTGKLAFRNARSDAGGQGEWLGLNTLWEGSILEAELKSSINTDLPGEITAIVTKNVYSSQNGKYLLIPQNSILVGSYNSEISYSQSRVQVGWYTLIRPDGYRIDLGNMNGTDSQGRAGVRGFINDHPLAYLKAIGLMTVFNIVNSEFQNTIDTTNNEYAQNLAANSQSVIVEMGQKLIDRAMNVQPTIKIKEGTIIKVFVNSTLTLPPYEAAPAVTGQYRRY